MKCMHRATRTGREILPDRTLGRRVAVEGASCPNAATHEVWVDGRFLGAYCAEHDHPSRAVVRKVETSSLGTVGVFDVHTGDRVGIASLEMQGRHPIGLPFDVFEGGVKQRLVLKRYTPNRKHPGPLKPQPRRRS